MPDDNLEINLERILGAVKAPSIQQLTLYIPDKDKNGKSIKNIHKWIKGAHRLLTVIGGGANIMPPVDGSWLKSPIDDIEDLKDEDIVWEKTRMIYTYIKSDKFKKNLKQLREFLHRFGRETNQGEVVFEFDGRFFRICKYNSK